MNLTPKKVRDRARYLKLTPRGIDDTWSADELQLLDDWAETKPLRVFVKAWNSLALRQGRPRRSLRAIEKKLLQRGHSTKVEIEYYSVPAVARLMNRSESWVKLLIKEGKLGHVKEGKNSMVKVRHLRKFVFDYPFDATARLTREQFADLLIAIKDL